MPTDHSGSPYGKGQKEESGKFSYGKDDAYVIEDEKSSTPTSSFPAADPPPRRHGKPKADPHTPVATGDDVYAATDMDDPLAKMYVKKERAAPSANRLVINEGAPVEQRELKLGWVKWVVILLILAGGGFALTLVKKTYVTATGATATVSLPKYVWVFLSMPKEVREIQSLSEDEVAFLRTKVRLETAFTATYEYFQSQGVMPDGLALLVTRKLLAQSDASDGWGEPLRLEVRGSDATIRSTGADRTIQNTDDITFGVGGLKVPAEFEDIRDLNLPAAYSAP